MCFGPRCNPTAERTCSFKSPWINKRPLFTIVINIMFLNWNRALFIRPSWTALLFFQLGTLETQITHRANSEVFTRATWSPECHFGNKRKSFNEGWVPVCCRVIVSSRDDCVFSLYLQGFHKRGHHVERRRRQRMTLRFWLSVRKALTLRPLSRFVASDLLVKPQEMRLPVAKPKAISPLQQTLKKHCCASSETLQIHFHCSSWSITGKRSRVCWLTVHGNRYDTVTDSTVVNIH